MTLVLELKPEIEANLQRFAKQNGVEPSEYACSLLEERLKAEELSEEELRMTGWNYEKDGPKPQNGEEWVAWLEKNGVIGSWAHRTDLKIESDDSEEPLGSAKAFTEEDLEEDWSLETDEPKPQTGAELVARLQRDGVIGAWADRTDLKIEPEDSEELSLPIDIQMEEEWEQELKSLETDEPKPQTGAELVARLQRDGVIGAWADRTDIGDSTEFVQRLRKQQEARWRK